MFLFAVILAVFELILHFAYVAFEGNGALFTFSPMVPIVLLVLMRWNWVAVFYAVGDGVLYCLLNGGTWQNYLIYCVGNAFIMLLLLYNRFVGKERVTKKVVLSLLYVVLGWLATVVGRAVVAACIGINFVEAFTGQLYELLSLVIGIIIVMIMRRLDGMFEDQKHYLKRIDAERAEMTRRDEYGDEPIDIDEETLSILKKFDGDWE